MKWHSHSLHQDQYHQPFCTIVVWWFLLSLSQPAVVEEMMEENQESSGAPRRLAKHMKLNRTRKKPVAMGTKVRWEDKVAWWAFHSTQKSNTPSPSQHSRVRDNWPNTLRKEMPMFVATNFLKVKKDLGNPKYITQHSTRVLVLVAIVVAKLNILF